MVKLSDKVRNILGGRQSELCRVCGETTNDRCPLCKTPVCFVPALYGDQASCYLAHLRAAGKVCQQEAEPPEDKPVVRISLSEVEFKDLVRGELVFPSANGDVELAVDDIGFAAMEAAIIEARIDSGAGRRAAMVWAGQTSRQNMAEGLEGLLEIPNYG